MQQHIPGGSQTQAAYYGIGGVPTFMVVAGKLARRPTTADVTAFFSNSGTAADPKLTKMGSGQFGGTLECGTATVTGRQLTTCASIDSAAAIIVVAATRTRASSPSLPGKSSDRSNTRASPTTALDLQRAYAQA